MAKTLNGHPVRRKNLYMPCIIGERVEGMTDEEYAAILNATYWADNITNAEWPAVLREEGFSPSARSRLKKKAAGWMIALGRIALLNPELYEEIAERAISTYEEQVEADYPKVDVVGPILDLQKVRNWRKDAKGAFTVQWWVADDEDGAA